jgi:hypothetical protein
MRCILWGFGNTYLDIGSQYVCMAFIELALNRGMRLDERNVGRGEIKNGSMDQGDGIAVD